MSEKVKGYQIRSLQNAVWELTTAVKDLITITTEQVAQRNRENMATVVNEAADTPVEVSTQRCKVEFEAPSILGSSFRRCDLFEDDHAVDPGSGALIHEARDPSLKPGRGQQVLRWFDVEFDGKTEVKF